MTRRNQHSPDPIGEAVKETELPRDLTTKAQRAEWRASGKIDLWERLYARLRDECARAGMPQVAGAWATLNALCRHSDEDIASYSRGIRAVRVVEHLRARVEDVL